jgi:ketosteroid isomerase-like protein
MADPEALAEMFAERECAKLLRKYARLADGDDVDGFVELFTPGGVWGRADGTAIEGREAIRSAYSSRPRRGASRHQLLGVSVEFIGARRAEGVSTALVVKSEGSSSKQVHILSYVDRFEQSDDGRWLIASRSSELLATHTMVES